MERVRRTRGDLTQHARPLIPVAAGCIRNAAGDILICQRPAGKIAAGKWEFPGGKIEPGESAHAALVRELREELGIVVTAARPLIRVRHEYTDRSVVLDTWLVTAYEGALVAHDGQAFAWVRPDDLAAHDLLAADIPIVAAVRLPEHYVFTPPAGSEDRIRGGLARLPRGALLRLRLPELGDAAYEAMAARLAPACRAGGLRLILDRDPGMVGRLGAQGWHATATALMALHGRPVGESSWFGASCHSAAELAAARRLRADFAVAGPVLPTASHRGHPGLGWDGFAELAAECGLPVYAIGGVGPAQLATAWQRHGQGVAGISAYWGLPGFPGLPDP